MAGPGVSQTQGAEDEKSFADKSRKKGGSGRRAGLGGSGKTTRDSRRKTAPRRAPDSSPDETAAAAAAAPGSIGAEAGRETVNLTDEELMRLCQNGYEKAFEILFGRYQDPALSFIQRLTGDPSRVEALGQEAFLRIFRKADSYQYPRRFATWFYTIVRNLCKNEMRWRSRHPTVSLDVPGGGREKGGEELRSTMRERLSGGTVDPLDRLANAELEARLQEALGELPDSEREVLILSRFQGFRYREIAEIVGLPVTTVRTRVHSALERLRRAIKDYL